jgi:predicted GIY-YIG superfamily endonuclease
LKPNKSIKPASYYLIDCNGEITYIGVTSDLAKRDFNHTKQDKRYQYECPQCPLIMVPTGQVYNSRVDCEAEETRQIIQKRPIFNDADNPDPLLIRKLKRANWRYENCRDKQCN